MRFSSLLILFTILIINISFAQEISKDSIIDDNETLLIEEEEDIMVEDTIEGIVFKPIIGAGLGIFSFYSDVNDYFRTPLNGLTSIRVSVSRNISKNFDIDFNGTFGEVSGSQYAGNSDTYLNFKTSLFLGGFSLVYNFNSLLKRKRPIHPYISLGAEILQFSPKGDLVSGNGKKYNYWSDGTIRDMEEKVGNNGNIITRDYVYESDLRKLDVHGYGDYSKTSFAIPIDVGLNVTITDRVTARMGAAFHFAMTDYIDNYVGKSAVWKNDIVLNSYVSISVDLFSPANEITAVENFRNIKFTITDNQDQDGDKVDDFNDECPNTPSGVEVNFRGCPLDEDKDGVPDYLDKDNETPLDFVAVGSNGVSILDKQLISILYDPDAVRRSDTKVYNENTTTPEVVNSTGVPDKFKEVDTNKDNYISLDEFNEAITNFFEQKSNLTPADLEELKLFLFNQE